MKKYLSAGLVFLVSLFAILSVSTAVAATDTQGISPYPLGERGVLTHRAVEARLQPVGTVCVKGEDCGVTVVAAADSGSKAPRSGEAVYKAHCAMCHASGVAGAPKFGTADWKPHIAKGMPTLYKHAMEGFNAMPPKGMCSNCSEQEIKNAVDYMVDNSKGK